MAPGLQVARIDANKWVVTSRGFAERFSNKLLVLVNGRSVYTPLFSGVYWDAQDTLLADKVAQTDEGEDASGREGADAWHALRGAATRRAALGARRRARHRRCLPGRGPNPIPRSPVAPPGAPGAETGEIAEDDGRSRGGHLLGRWSRTLSPASDLALQLKYDRTERRELLFGERRETLDADFQRRFGMARHEVVWGLGYRLTRGELETGEVIAFDPSIRTDQLWSAFGQDDLTLVPGRRRLTLGSKFEHNDHTGFEVQPNARLLRSPGGASRSPTPGSSRSSGPGTGAQTSSPKTTRAEAPGTRSRFARLWT